MEDNISDTCNDITPSDTVLANVQSKRSLVSPVEETFDYLVSLLRDRLNEGQGECIYEVGSGVGSEFAGLNEADLKSSVDSLRALAKKVNAEVVHLRTKLLTVPGESDAALSELLHLADYLVRRQPEPEDFLEVRVAVVGNVDAGKSTLLGVLTHNELDNGRGQARLKLFRHKHEVESGRTSSVSNDILGFNACGDTVNKPEHGHLNWMSICRNSAKVITFIDLAGHERYLKTTVFGMTGHAPDFTMLMIGANAGLVGMTKEHLGLALALNVPVFVVVTKIDMCPDNVLKETLSLLNKVLKSPGCRKIPVSISTSDHVITCVKNFTSQRLCPVFQVSNVSGQNLDLLKMFLNLIVARIPEAVDDPFEFQIDDHFAVPGVGTVVSGTCMRGQVQQGDKVFLGPDVLGNYQEVIVKSIHRKRLPVHSVRGSQTAAFSLKKQIRRSALRKGMVMLSCSVTPVAFWEFEAEILVLHHPTTISIKYQAMVHVGSVRQTACILDMSCEHMRTGDRAKCRFRFIKFPEYLRIGTRLVFREGRTKAVGTITNTFPDVIGHQQNQRKARAEKKAKEMNHAPCQKTPQTPPL